MLTEKEKLVESLGNLALLASAMADAASDIAAARRALYLAYVDEGFTEPQALELCKTIQL